MVNKYDNYDLKKVSSLENVPGTIKDGDGYIWDPSELPDKDFDDSKVPLNYRRLAIWMRSKLFGKDVRETIARLAEMFGLNFKELMESFESLDNRQDAVESYTAQSVAQMKADKNAVIANATVDSEVILARGGKATLRERLDDTNTQLAQKVNKGNVSVSDINKNLGKLDQTFMSEEFLQQMAGTTPVNAVPGPKSVTTGMLADKSVTNGKISADGLSAKNISGIYNIGTVNKFDKDAMIKGSYHGISGSLFQVPSYGESQLIPVESGKKYKTNANIITYWGSSGNFISGENLIHPVNEITINNHEIKGVKLAMDLAKSDTIMLTASDKYPYSGYVGYNYFTFDENLFDIAKKSDLATITFDARHINGIYNVGTVNKFDKDSITKEWYHNHIGAYHGPGPYSESQFIRVDSEKRYRTNAEIVSFWDSSGNFLSGESLIYEINEIQIPSPDVEYVKIAMETTKVDTIMFTESDKYPYGKYVGYNYFAFDNDYFDVVKRSELNSMSTQKPSPLLEEIMNHDFVFTIGYDDASSSIYEHAWPVHKTHDVPGTFWVTTGMVEGEVASTTWGDIVTWEQLREMQNSDVGKITVGSHSHSHMNHGIATAARLNSDASTAMDIFKREGFKPKYMAYPGGLSSKLAKQYMSIYFKAARGAGVNEGFHIGHNNGESERYFTDSVNCDRPSVENIKGIITTAKNQKDKKKMVWLDIFVHMVHPSGFDTKGGVVKTPDQISEIIQFVKDNNGLVLSFDDAVSAFMENYYWTEHNSHQVIQ